MRWLAQKDNLYRIFCQERCEANPIYMRLTAPLFTRYDNLPLPLKEQFGAVLVITRSELTDVNTAGNLPT